MIRIIGYFFGIGTTLALLLAGAVAVYIGSLAKDLPDYEVLANYEPPVTTRVHAADGALMGEFARERRLYLPIQAVPDRVKAAFLSARNDALANVAIIAAGLVTAFVWYSPWPDLIVGLAIAAINFDAARDVWEAAREERRTGS